ncbi:MAG: ABC transporter ATP-binding protein [Myxococcales bacterium]|nr:ABC transporter ATP-binding protein [Myxococcales bacterium]
MSATPRAVVASPKGKQSIHEEDALGEALDFELLKRLWPFVKPHARPLLLSMLLLPVVAVLVTARPRIMQWALDAGIARRDVGVVDKAAALYFVVVVAELFLRFLQIYVMQLAGARAMADLRSKVFGFLQKARLGFYDNQPVGRLVTRVTNDIDALGELFATGALNAIGDFLSLALIVVMMFTLEWHLATIALVTLPPLALAANFIRKRARLAFRDIRGRTARLNSYMGEQVQGVAVTQAYGREEACREEFDLENDGYRQANHQAILWDATLDAIVEGVSIICAALILWFIGLRGVSLGAAVVSFGTFVAFLQYLEQFFIPIRDLTARYTVLQSAMAGAERVFSLLDQKNIDDAPDGLPIGPEGDPSFAVELDHVEFSYKKDVPVLRGVDLVAKKGEHVAIVGATGAGKSTIAALVLRLYERNEGVVRVLGKDVRAWDPRELRRKFAVVPQDVYLFSGTIATNVAMGEEVDLTKVEAALERIGSLDFFKNRDPLGLEAKVGERGSGLSTGERQLVAFARALYRNPDILILDEATASVDSDTEARLQRALEAVLEGRTAIVIAHRLSTIRAADRVVVMHRGKVAEQGTHDELLAHGGLYAKLHQLQFAERRP